MNKDTENTTPPEDIPIGPILDEFAEEIDEKSAPVTIPVTRKPATPKPKPMSVEPEEIKVELPVAMPALEPPVDVTPVDDMAVNTIEEPSSNDSTIEELSAEINAVESGASLVTGDPAIDMELHSEAAPTPENSPLLNASPALTDTKAASDKKRMWLFIGIGALVVLGVLLAILLVFFNPKDTAAPNTTEADQTHTPATKKLDIAVTLHEGTVEYSNDGDEWQALTDNTGLAENYQVRTGTDSRAILTLDDGSAIRLDASSRISIDSLEVGNIVITHLEGETYSRVVPSKRSYIVKVDDIEYKALGTAFVTISKPAEKGVQVLQSSVKASNVSLAIDEGKQYFKTNTNSGLADKVTDINLDTLADNKFITWNLSEDEKLQLFKDKLGVLDQVKQKVEEKEKQANDDKKQVEEKALKDKQAADEKAKKEAENKAKDKKEKETSTGEKVTRGTITAHKSGNRIMWSYTGKAVYGYKLVYSQSNPTPTFGQDDAAYYSDSRSNMGDIPKNSKYIRICAYTNNTEDEPCVDYSDAIKL